MDTLGTPVQGTKHPRPSSPHHAWPVKNCIHIFLPINRRCILSSWMYLASYMQPVHKGKVHSLGTRMQCILKYAEILLHLRCVLGLGCTMQMVDLQRITYLIYARAPGSMRPNEEIMKLGKKCLPPNINPPLATSPFSFGWNVKVLGWNIPRIAGAAYWHSCHDVLRSISS